MTPDTGMFVSWLLTALLHATVLLGVAAVIDAFASDRALALRQLMWRTALYGSLVTASAQALLGFEPAAGRWSTPQMPAPVAAALTAGEHAFSSASTVVEVARTRNTPSTKPTAAPAPRSTAWDRIRREPATLLAATWLALLLVAIARMSLRALRLRKALNASTPLVDPGIATLAARLAGFARIAAPRLLAARAASPMATAGGRVVVPEWALRDCEPQRLEAMLAHEIAHLARRDPRWQATDALVHALLFAHPLALLARRRLEAIAELSADAWAARAIGGGRALAEGIAACAERLAPAPRFALATAMASTRSPLIHRIERLLQEDIMNPEFRIPGLRALALVAIVAAAVALPAIGTRATASASDDGEDVVIGTWSSTTDWGFGETMRAGVKRPGYTLSVKAKGKLEFDAAESDVASMDDGAVMEIEETRGSTTHRIEFEGDGGQVQRRYSIDGDDHVLDAEGREWLATVIPAMLRTTGFDAERRVGRIVERGGANAVLDEVDLIPGDYVRRVYLGELVRQVRLEPAQFDRAIVLTEKIESDFEKRTVLQAFLEAGTLAPAQQVGVLTSAAGIESDFEKRTVLETAAEQAAPDPAVRAAWLKAASSIESDFERRTAIEAIAERGKLDAEWTAAAIEGVRGIESDFELRTALQALAPSIGASEALAAAYASAAGDIGSDFERREALIELVDEAELSVDGFRAVLASANDIESDFECGQVLQAVAAHMPADASLISDYRRVARKLGNHERGQAERALDRLEI